MITEQVTNGVAVRMAVLYELLGSGAPVACELVIQGGRVVDETGERTADVLVVDGRIVEVGAGLPETASSTRAGASSRPASSTSTSTSASPDGGRRDHRDRRAAAALGGFTAVVAMPNTTPPLDDPAVVARCSPRGALRVRRAAAGASRGAGGGRAGADGRAPLGWRRLELTHRRELDTRPEPS